MSIATATERRTTLHCDVPGCDQEVVLELTAAEDNDYSGRYRILAEAARRSWALYDSKAVCPTDVRRLVLIATGADCRFANMKHAVVLRPASGQDVRRSDDYIALCDWPGCNLPVGAPVHRDASGRYLT